MGARTNALRDEMWRNHFSIILYNNGLLLVIVCSKASYKYTVKYLITRQG